MDLASPEPPEPVYRDLDRCDLCGAPLAPREQLAGVCARCRQTISQPAPVVASGNRPANDP